MTCGEVTSHSTGCAVVMGFEEREVAYYRFQLEFSSKEASVTAALGGARQIGGALVLLQIWAWSRIHAPPPAGTVSSSFQAPPLPSTVSSSFQAPLSLSTVGSSTPHMPISYASSSDSSEHDDERTNDGLFSKMVSFSVIRGFISLTLGFPNMPMWILHLGNNSRPTLNIIIARDAYGSYFTRVEKKSWTLPTKGMISDAKLIQRQIVSITHDRNTINMMDHVTTITQMVSDEPSMLYPIVSDDGDEIDHCDEDYIISSQSESDDNNDAEEEELQTPVNPVSENTLTQ
ncbi:hypothetical protein M9H77_28424 [Catharanthus roseus]|uniref:Uncharacterized protein n=1 Tax=Catharanthus roseus TaxID=4058 RepID=A0ACC0AGA3_CATRO|nr:hypothetical protein M9H77_28424 [Catharanthus roseus]